MKKFQKSVLIIGCSPRGIGNALAREFQAQGLRVFATASTVEAIQDLADLGITTLSLEADQEKSINSCKEKVMVWTGGRLDYLVNNAGISCTVPAIEADFSEMESLFATNFFAVVRLCQAFMPLLQQSKGTIVQIGSIAGYFPYMWGSIYNASKAALVSYSAALRIEIAPLGVHVITVVTGPAKSRIARVKRRLQEHSAYKELEYEYQQRQILSQEVGMDGVGTVTDLYAKKIVTKVLGAEGRLWKTKTIWAGGNYGPIR